MSASRQLDLLADLIERRHSLDDPLVQQSPPVLKRQQELDAEIRATWRRLGGGGVRDPERDQAEGATS